ncbi:alpha/beta fold hydrolase [Mariniluteicoccus endophyticus]
MATVALHTQSEVSNLPLLLLPPFPFDHRVWSEVAEALEGDVVLVDAPGFGGDADDEPSLEAYTEAVLLELDARGQHRFVVAGNSMGGYVAMAMLEAAPHRVAGIGLFGTKSTADPDEARKGRLKMADGADRGELAGDLLRGMKPNLLGETTRTSRPDLARTIDEWADAAPLEGIAWAQRAMAARPDRTHVLEEADVPAVVVRGTEDGLMDEAAHQTLADALGCEVQEVEAGHLIPLEAPDACVRALTDLWERARG